MSKLRLWLMIFAVVGAILSAYALSLHYASDDSSFCNISANFNCDKVNKSPWAEFMGIPVALGGLLAYLLVFLLVLKEKTLKKALGFTKKDYWRYLGGLILVMFLFQVYLTYVEAVYIHAYCLVCLGSQLIVLLMLVLSGKEYFS